MSKQPKKNTTVVEEIEKHPEDECHKEDCVQNLKQFSAGTEGNILLNDQVQPPALLDSDNISLAVQPEEPAVVVKACVAQHCCGQEEDVQNLKQFSAGTLAIVPEENSQDSQDIEENSQDSQDIEENSQEVEESDNEDSNNYIHMLCIPHTDGCYYPWDKKKVKTSVDIALTQSGIVHSNWCSSMEEKANYTIVHNSHFEAAEEALEDVGLQLTEIQPGDNDDECCMFYDIEPIGDMYDINELVEPNEEPNEEPGNLFWKDGDDEILPHEMIQPLQPMTPVQSDNEDIDDEEEPIEEPIEEAAPAVAIDAFDASYYDYAFLVDTEHMKTLVKYLGDAVIRPADQYSKQHWVYTSACNDIVNVWVMGQFEGWELSYIDLMENLPAVQKKVILIVPPCPAMQKSCKRKRDQVSEDNESSEQYSSDSSSDSSSSDSCHSSDDDDESDEEYACKEDIVQGDAKKQRISE